MAVREWQAEAVAPADPRIAQAAGLARPSDPKANVTSVSKFSYEDLELARRADGSVYSYLFRASRSLP
jgi:hypothetical protein